MITSIYLKIAAVVALVALLAGGLYYVREAGYKAGAASIQAQWDSATAQAAKAALLKDQQNQSVIQKAQNDYETIKAQLASVRAANTAVGLFYTPKQSSCNLSGSPSASPGTSATSATNGQPASAINLSDLEKQIIDLGNDRDNLAAQLNAVLEIIDKDKVDANSTQ